MSDDLIRLLKDRLDLVELARAAGLDLVRAGVNFKARCCFHEEATPSLHFYAAQGTFKCFGCGKRGDQLTWLALQRFRTDRPDKEQFVGVLKEACAIVGVEFPERGHKDEAAVTRAKARRKIESVLDEYALCAEHAWTKDAWERAVELKPYLTEDLRAAWRLGYAPTLEQLNASGISEDALRFAGLLRDSTQREGERYLHFRDSLIIPFVERERVVFLADRTLGDRKPKCLSLPAPAEQGAGGVAMPDGFNLDALYDREAIEKGLLVVEAPLDAIACTARGHPALAMVTSAPRPGLVARIRKAVG